MFSSRDPPEANVGVKNVRFKNIYIQGFALFFFLPKIAYLQAHIAALGAVL